MKNNLNLKELMLGIVLNIPNDFTIQFVSSHIKEIKIGTIVGVKSEEEGDTWVLGEVNNVNPRYYMRDSENYFLGRIIKNDLEQLLGSEVEQSIGIDAQARILGFYRKIENHFEALQGLPNRYTCYPRQKVYLIDISQVKCIYGLTDTGLHIGEVRFPKQQTAIVNAESFFQTHSLICGMTGTGKTRLAASLAIGLAEKGANIIVIDPHDEYETILAKNSQDIKISKFSRDYIDTKEEVIAKNKIQHKPLQFKMSALTPSVLIELLPNVNPQQAELIYKSFKFADALPGPIKIGKLFNMLKKTIEIDVTLTKACEDVIAKIRSNQELLSENVQDWTEAKQNRISILISEKEDRFTERFITAVLQHVLTKQAKIPKIILIEECHQLFKVCNNDNIRTGELLEQLLREARKFGTAIILVTQVESDIPVAVCDQIQNRFHFRDVRNQMLSNLSDRLCRVSLRGSQTEFLMWINEIK